MFFCIFSGSIPLKPPLLVNLALLSEKPTGLTTYAANVFPHLRSLDPTLLIPSELPNYACYPVPQGLTSDQGAKGHFRRLMWTQFTLPTIYRQLNANLLFSPVPEAPLFSACRFVVMVHDFIPLRFPKWRSPLTHYHRYYVPQVLKQAQHIVCNSRSTAEDVVRFHRIPEQKISVIPLAYDRKNFRPLNLPARNYFLYLGRIDPYKNVQGLIAAFSALPDRQEYELWIAGPRDRRFVPTLQAQIEQLGLAKQIKFLDYVVYSELPILLSQAIALVFPSLWEGFGLPVLEAMACGAPVITSNLSALPEVAGDAAILVDPHSVGAIADAMKSVATDAHLRLQLQESGLARSSQFSWEQTGQATVDVLKGYL